MQGSSLQVEILSVRLSFYHFPYSDSKLTQPPPVDLSHTTSPTVSNVPHPCLPCPPVNWPPFPVNWSPNEQDHITDLSFPLGVEFWHFSQMFYIGAGLHDNLFLRPLWSTGLLLKQARLVEGREGGCSRMDSVEICVEDCKMAPSCSWM